MARRVNTKVNPACSLENIAQIPCTFIAQTHPHIIRRSHKNTMKSGTRIADLKRMLRRLECEDGRIERLISSGEIVPD